MIIYLNKFHGQLDKFAIFKVKNRCPQQVDINHIKHKCKHVIKIIKQSAIINTIPGYIIIGPSNAGKTSLLRYAGLNFPLASEQEQSVLDSMTTVNANWWLSDKAMFLDTAGRYMTGLEHQPEWIALLKVLKRQRRHLPLRGIILVLNVIEFQQSRIADINSCANSLRQRINDIYHHLGYKLPIFVVMSHIDRLSGFTEFYADIPEQQKYQAWGLSDLCDDSCFQFYSQLAKHRIQQLLKSNDQDTLARIYQYPEVMKDVLAQLSSFTRQFLNSNPYQKVPALQSVHFVSSLKTDGDTTGHSYFSRELLDSWLLTHTTPPEILTRVNVSDSYRRMAVRGIFVTVMTFYLSFSVYAFRHQTETVKQQLNTLTVLASSTTNKQVAFRHLQNCYSQLQRLAEPQGIDKWLSHLGLRPLNPLFERYERLFMQGMSLQFAEPVLNLLKQSLKNSRAPYRYSDLKWYIKLGYIPDVSDASLSWLYARLWSKLINVDSRQLQKIIHYYLEHRWQLPLVNHQQTHAMQAPFNHHDASQRIFDATLQQIQANRFLEDKASIAIDSELIANSQLQPWHYTQTAWLDAWQSWFAKRPEAISDFYNYTWINAEDLVRNSMSISPRTIERLEREIKQRYCLHAHEAWTQWLIALRLSEVNSKAQLLQQFHQLANQPSVLLTLYERYQQEQHDLAQRCETSPPPTTAMPDLQAYWHILESEPDISLETLAHKLKEAINAQRKYLINKPALRALLLLPLRQIYHYQDQTWLHRLRAHFHELSHYFPFKSNNSDLALSQLKEFFALIPNDLPRALIQKNTDLKKWLQLKQLLLNPERQIQVRFSIYPLPSPGIKLLVLTIGRQMFTYRNGPQVWQHFVWPNQSEDSLSSLRIVNTQNHSHIISAHRGVWSFWRVLADGKLKNLGNSRVLVSWGKIHFILRVDKPSNIFYVLLHKSAISAAYRRVHL